MTTTGKPTTDCCRASALALVLAVALASTPPALAGDAAVEHAQLAALVRQLDLLERTALHSANLARAERARYHFDYARLQQDIERIRAGIRDYLTPQRAQPRDPVELLGDYRQFNRSSDEESTQ
ncbi:raqprd family integrative conjugative element protein [Azoarcus communis]|uniref:integrative conjugative element protein, RAQPRD family n=1 Tax=Parazoarcus communis TaxID=41977 RepID=UPI0014592F02|nr:RAQPRD family integrative conjugative element protein [Parazoarcus communis]NMG49981.1 raqprd family integrative conjugative element protein [Parazoarcus communis]